MPQLVLAILSIGKLKGGPEKSGSPFSKGKQMKILALIIAVLLTTPVFANDSQRKVSSNTLNAGTVTAVKAAPGTLYDVEIVATGSNAWVSVFDYAATSGSQNGTKLVELGEATSGNSKHVNLGDYGIKASKGLVVWTSNATAIIHYQ